MARIKVQLVGTTPLMLHNIALADPDNPIVQEISAITKKRTKTEEDRRAIEKLEWYGGLYLVDGIQGPIMPTANIRKCFIQGAKNSKKGTQMQRAIAFTDLYVPIAYDGPRDIDELFQLKQFHNRASVGIQGKRVMRVRPQFPTWAISATAELLTEAMDEADFRNYAEFAGRAEGLCENRVNGYGRFTVTLG